MERFKLEHSHGLELGLSAEHANTQENIFRQVLSHHRLDGKVNIWFIGGNGQIH